MARSVAFAAAFCLAGGAVHADDLDITADTTSGINLDTFSGATARIFPGVTVSNTGTLIPGGVGSTFSAIFASTGTWTITNEGTVTANSGNGFNLKSAGNVVNNDGAINSGFQGIAMSAGGTVNNFVDATIETGSNGVFIGGAAGTVVNSGTIESTSVEGVTVQAGGTITNNEGALIEAHGENNAVSILGGSSRTVFNSGTIRSNETGYGTGVSLNSGELTNYATGQILGAYNGVWANGAGATTIMNSGLIEASQAAAIFGFPGSAIEADAGGTITNSGTIRSISTDSSDVAIYFAGGGSITNSGTLQSLSGGLAILFDDGSTHTLNLETGSVLGGNVQGGAGTDNLALMGTGTEDIGKFLDFETLSMQGTNWSLTGNTAFSTSTTVEDGVLRVNGQLTSPTVTVMADGTLGGGGTITGAVGNSGTIAPGNSIGTLNVSGSTTFSANSVFEVEINSSVGDELVVNGTVTIDSSAKVSVLAVPGTYTDGAEYLILDATTRLGEFGGVIDNSAFLDFALDHSRANQVWLVIATVTNFADVAETPNQFATAEAIQALDPGNPIFTAIANLDADAARAAFDSLSGEIHPSLRSLLLDDSRFIRDAATDRIRRAFADLAPLDGSVVAMHGGIADEPVALWGRVYGAFGDIEGDGNAATLDRTTGGIFFGADRAAFDVWRLGFIAGYSHSEADVDTRGSHGSIDSGHVALFGGARFGAVGLRFGGAYAWHGIDARRDIAFPGFAATATADYDAATAQAFGEAGYEFAFDAARIEPFLQAAFVDVTTDGFTEKDGAAALTAERESADHLVTTLGLHGAVEMQSGGRRLSVDGTLGWRHAFGDTAPDTTFAFDNGAGQPFEIAGVPIARDAARADFGLALQVSDRARLRAGYSGEIAADAQSHGLTGDFELRF